MKPTKRQCDPLGRSKTRHRYSRYLLSLAIAMTGSVWPIQARSIEAIFDTPLMVTCTVTVGATAGHTDVSLWYVVQGDRNSALDIDEREFVGVRWFAFTGIPAGRSEPNLNRFIAKLKNSRAKQQ
jgi:hypothetical protein